MLLTHRTQYLNFKPTDGFQLYANALITRLFDFAPSDSSTFSSIEKARGGYACKIEIISAACRFEALSDAAANPKSALEKARRRMLKQIAQWRRTRFVRK